MFKIWHALRNDWSGIYKKKHIYPIVFWGLQLCKGAIAKWREFVKEKKALKVVASEALEWRRAQVVKDVLRKWLNCQQQEVWKLQKRSGMSDRELRIGLKFGIRWRLRCLHNDRVRIPVIRNRFSPPTSGLALDYSFIPRPRPAPKIPDFLFNSENGRFVKMEYSQPPALSSFPTTTALFNGEMLLEKPKVISDTLYLNLNDKISIKEKSGLPTIDIDLPSANLIATDEIQVPPAADEEWFTNLSRIESEPHIVGDEFCQVNQQFHVPFSPQEIEDIQYQLLQEKKAFELYLDWIRMLQSTEISLKKYAEDATSHQSQLNLSELLSVRSDLVSQIHQYGMQRQDRRDKVMLMKARLAESNQSII